MGLLARSEEIRSTLNQPPVGPRLVVDNLKNGESKKRESSTWDSQYTQEEQKQILEQIDIELQENRLVADQDTFEVKSASKGWVLPFVVNTLALLILLVFFFTMRYISQNRRLQETYSPQTFVLTEAKLLEEVRRESANLLDQKDQELEEIRLEMASIEAQRAELEDRFSQDFSSYQLQVQQDMEAAIQAEIQRLREQGYAEDEINRRIAQFRNQKELEMNSLLEEERARLAVEKAQQEEALNQLTSEYQGALTSLNQEKQELEASYLTRLEALEAQLQEAQDSSVEAQNEAEQELLLLSEQKELEQSIENQITGFYSTIHESLRRGDYEEAQNNLNLFRDFVQGDRYSSMESIARNRDTDLFLISSLEELTAYSSGGEAVPGSLAYDPQALALFQEEMDQASTQAAQGEWDKALVSLESAMDQLPQEYLASNLWDVFNQVKASVVTAEQRIAEEQTIVEQTAALNRQWLLVSQQDIPDEEKLSQYMTLLGEYPKASSAQEKFLEWQQTLIRSSEVHAAQKADLNQQLEQMDLQTRELRAEMDSLTEDHRIAEDQWNAEIRDFEQQMEELDSSLLEAQGQIRSLENTITLLEDTSDEEAILSALNSDLAEVRGERDRLLYMQEAYNQLQQSYLEYTQAEDQLFEQGITEGSLIEGKQLLNQFLSLNWIQEIFPGFAERIKVYDKAFEESGQEDITLEMADLIFIYSTIDSQESRLEWLEEQKETYDTPEMEEFFESLELLGPDY